MKLRKAGVFGADIIGHSFLLAVFGTKEMSSMLIQMQTGYLHPQTGNYNCRGHKYNLPLLQTL